MGESGSVSESQQTTNSPLDYLDQLCDYALSIGMSYHDYWYEPADMLLRYHKAEQIRQKKRNTELWLQGLYVHIAIGDLVPVLNPFSKEHKAKPYLQDPIPLTHDEALEQENKKYERFKQQMFNLVKKKE